MKFIKIMVVTLALALSAASASYAAASFISSSTANMMAPNARNGLAGTVTLIAVSTGTIPIGETLINSYGGAQISVLSTICVKATIATGVQFGFGTTAACTAAGVTGTIVSAAGFTAYGVALTSSGIMSVTVNQTNITINFLTGIPFTVTTDGFEYSGVRLNVVQLTGGTTVNKTINSTITSILSQVSTTNPYLPVAYTREPLSMAPAAAAVAVGPLESVSTIMAIEGAALFDAFVTNGAAAPTQVIFQISGIPVGVNVTNAAIAAAPSGYTRVGSTARSRANGVVAGATPPVVGSFTQTGTTATVTVNILSSDPAIQEVVPVTITFSSAATTPPADAAGTAFVTLGPEVAGAAALTSLAPPIIPLAFGTNGPVAYQTQWALAANPPDCEIDLNLSWTGVLNTNVTFGLTQPADFNLYLGIMNYSIPLISAVPVPAIQPSISVSIPLSIPSYGNVGVFVTLVTSEGVICGDWKTIYTGPKAP